MNSRPARSTCERPSEGSRWLRDVLNRLLDGCQWCQWQFPLEELGGWVGYHVPQDLMLTTQRCSSVFSLRFAPKGTMGPHTLRELLRRQCCSTRFHVCLVLYWIVVVQGCSRVSCTRVCGTSGSMHLSLFDQAQFNGWACPISKRPARDREETLI